MLPAYRSLEIDHEGNIWVEDYRRTAEDEWYQVFSAEGVWLGEVRVPTGRSRHRPNHMLPNDCDERAKTRHTSQPSGVTF